MAAAAASLVMDKMHRIIPTKQGKEVKDISMGEWVDRIMVDLEVVVVFLSPKEE